MPIEPDGKRCLHCGMRIDYMNYECNYTEYGTASGTVDMNGDEETEDHSNGDSDYNEYEYKCPECDCQLEWDFFSNEDDYYEGEEEEEVAAHKPEAIICNAQVNKITVQRKCKECNHSFSELINEESSFCEKCGADLNE